jgi:response regulator RpfG family c-di-GMP phosphodiesterase
VRTHLSLVGVDELKKTRLEIVQRLGLAAEYKDNETGLHVIRMSHYARILGLAVGMTEAEAEDLLHAAPMHDVGKIGIPTASCASRARSTRTNGRSCSRTPPSAATSSASTSMACWPWPTTSP